MKKFSISICVLLLFSVLMGCVSTNDGFIFGTYYSVSAKNISKKEFSTLSDELTTIDTLISTSVVTSDLHKINDSDSNIAVLCNPLTISLLSKAKEYFAMTNGAFNAAIFPLVELWRFDPINYNLNVNTIPSDINIKDTLDVCSLDNFVIDVATNSITKLVASAKLDFGGFAKGYAVDAAYEILAHKDDLMVNIGGTIRTNSSKKIGITNPRDDGIFGAVNINNMAISTSGDYQRYYIIGSQRYHHILNLDGYPSKTDNIISVSIVGENAMLCDALSTSVMILGIEKSKELLSKFNYSAIIITEQNYAIIGELDFEIYNNNYKKLDI